MKGQRAQTLGRRGDRDGRPVERRGHELRGIIGGGAVPRVPPNDVAFCVALESGGWPHP